MKLAAASLVAAASLAVCGSAHAAGFEDFRILCVQTGAAADVALARADAGGWKPIPPAILEQVTDKSMTNAQGRMRADDGAITILLVADGSSLIPNTTARLQVCAMGFVPPNAAAADALRAWAGVPEDATVSKSGVHGFVFAEGPNGHRQVDVTTSDAEAKALIAARNLNVAFTNADPQVTMIGYATASK